MKNKLNKQIDKLEKEILKSNKCKMCKQLFEDFGIDCNEYILIRGQLTGIRFAKDGILEILDNEIEIVKSRKTKGLPILKMESIGTLNKLKKKIQGQKHDTEKASQTVCKTRGY